MADIDCGTSESRWHKGPELLRIVMAALIVAVLFATSISLLSDDSSSEIPPAPTPAGTSYTSHVPISINGNAQFNHSNFPNNGIVSGNGTVSDPYIIENYEINAAGYSYAITIQNTNAFFKIIGCYVHDANSDGISLSHVSNASLIDNDCFNNCIDIGGAGISLLWSNNNILSNNNCSYNVCHNLMASYGINLYECDNNSIENNTCTFNLQGGISLDTVSNSRFANNTVSVNWMGITFDGGSDCFFINNNCSNNTGDGMRLTYITHTTFQNNTLFYNDYNGMLFFASCNNLLTQNNCSYNTRSGIRFDFASANMYGCKNNSLSGNVFWTNVQYGVYIQNAPSRDNRIWNCTFHHNNGAGDAYDPAHIQAYDAGTDNWWNSTNGYGNYWADWTTPDVVYRFGIVDLPYNVTGLAGAKDYFPLTSPKVIAPPIPEFFELIIPIVGLMLIALIVGRMRKKP